MPNPIVKDSKVLIVDDAATMRSMLRGLLHAEGYQVVGQLASGKGLLEAIMQTHPDIVCLDYHMPGENGLELLRQVQLAYPDVSVVMITGDTELDMEEKAAEEGAAGFIHKPFSPDKICQDMLQIVQTRELFSAARHAANNAKTIASPRSTAVIADDSAIMRTLLSSILAIANVKVVGEARDGKQAIELYNEHRPDFVCLDWNMPTMSGIDALRHIRMQHPDVRAIMITGRATREAIIEANQAGAKGYILKPFHPDKVISAIEKLMK